MIDPSIGILVPITAILAGVMFKYLKLKEKQLDAVTHETAEKAARYAAHTDRLEQRVRTLERIVTDKGVDIAEEIDGLRDAPARDRSLEGRDAQ